MTTTTTYLYKRSSNIKYWKDYLSRNLTSDEMEILSAVKEEHMLNEEINRIYNHAKKDNLYIPQLTQFSGNCLFESFEILGLCENHKLFRTGLAQLLVILKNVPNFLPGIETPLGELWQDYSEIDRVICSKTKKIYIYNYDAMCVDLSISTNWTRLNTELLMRIMCVLLNINIIIYRHDGHITNINESPNEDTLNIHLGQTGDTSQSHDAGFHYFPLKKIASNEEFPPCKTYTDDLSKFHTWARSMAKSLGRVGTT